MIKKMLLSGNEAIALAAKHCHVNLGVGYPGTPSSEILDEFSKLGGKAEWAPNEKVALEVAIGAGFAKGRALATMKHVGVNVAADPLFTIAYSGIAGGLVLISADDPGLASSQNEQDNRRYAISAGVPMLEPASSQECYDFLIKAFELSEKFNTLVLFRLTTRVCHSKTLVTPRENVMNPAVINYAKDIISTVMVPAFARIAHKRMRAKLAEITKFGEANQELTLEEINSSDIGVITTGISYMHVKDAAPNASVLKLGLTYPLPLERIKNFASKVAKCFVVEEGDPIVTEFCLANGIKVIGKAEMYRFNELNVNRVRRILAGDLTPEEAPAPGKAPQLCVGCPHRKSYQGIKELDLIVTGDIGCYTLGVLPPFEAVDTCVCMGASITTGLGMRHVLPESEARRVVSVIGDSTFWHTGINGIVEMVYNRPATGHVVIILDNATTAMTGMQEHAGTGFHLDDSPSEKLVIEKVVKAMGVDNVDVIDSTTHFDEYKELLAKRLGSNDLSVIVVRRPCILGVVKHNKVK